MGGDKQCTSSTRALLVLFIVKWRFGSGHLRMSEKKNSKKQITSHLLEPSTNLVLFNHPANCWQFFFFVFSCWTVCCVSKLGLKKNTHTHKTTSSVFFQEALKPNGVARIAPHWSSALGLRHLVPSSSSPRPPLVSGPSFVAL